jgi:hypothetical protein
MAIVMSGLIIAFYTLSEIYLWYNLSIGFATKQQEVEKPNQYDFG